MAGDLMLLVETWTKQGGCYNNPGFEESKRVYSEKEHMGFQFFVKNRYQQWLN